MKHFLFSIGLLLATFVAYGQLYFDLNAGYGLPVYNRGIIGEYDDDCIFLSNQTITEQSSKSEIIYKTFGQGYYFNLSVGKYFTNNFSVDINAGYALSSKIKSSYIETYEDWNDKNYDVLKLSQFYIKPMITFHITSKTKTSPFLSIGPIFSMPKMIWTDTWTDGNDTEIAEWVYAGNIALGLASKLGLEYKLNDKLLLIFSAEDIHMSYLPKKATLVKYTENGKNQLNNLEPSEKEIIFVKQLPNKQSENEPYKTYGYHYPLSTIAFNIGLRLKFSK